VLQFALGILNLGKATPAWLVEEYRAIVGQEQGTIVLPAAKQEGAVEQGVERVALVVVDLTQYTGSGRFQPARTERARSFCCAGLGRRKSTAVRGEVGLHQRARSICRSACQAPSEPRLNA